jgi:tripartite-type tricarboxylate transporter receptor subunit TctC
MDTSTANFALSYSLARRTMLRLKALCCSAALVLSFCVTVDAQTAAELQAQIKDYPTRPIKLIVPWPAGGGVDTAARIISQPLAERLGQPIVIDNKPGAGGNIGTALVAMENPDGYTLLMASTSPNAVNPHLYSRLGFDPVKDFVPIAMVYTVPSFLVVPASSPFNSVSELIAFAKANPGKLNFGSGGVGSSQHLFGVMFKSAADIDIVHVAYKGTNPAEAALMAGQIDLMLDPPTCLPLIAAGRLKVLAVATETRSSAMPDVPTLEQLGVKGVYTSTFYGVMAPANTPTAIVERLNKEINDILKTPAMRKRLADLNAEAGTFSAEGFRKYVDSEFERYGVIVKLSGAKQVD